MNNFKVGDSVKHYDIARQKVTLGTITKVDSYPYIELNYSFICHVNALEHINN